MLEKAIKYIKSIDSSDYDYAIILGSGWGEISKLMDVKHEIDYGDIPGYPTCNVAGHQGKMLLGTLCDKKIVLLMGRVHLYEGYTPNEVTLSIRLLHALGVKTLILTNASGGINKHFKPGNVMLITDHINYSNANPLTGVVATPAHPIFIDTSDIYTPKYIDLITKLCKQNNMPLQKGVYLLSPGPSYETNTEVKMYRSFGADAVGMSTVPEAIMAKYFGMEVIGLSCISNMAAGITKTPLTHEEVLQTTNDNREKLKSLIQLILSNI